MWLSALSGRGSSRRAVPRVVVTCEQRIQQASRGLSLSAVDLSCQQRAGTGNSTRPKEGYQDTRTPRPQDRHHQDRPGQTRRADQERRRGHHEDRQEQQTRKKGEDSTTGARQHETRTGADDDSGGPGHGETRTALDDNSTRQDRMRRAHPQTTNQQTK